MTPHEQEAEAIHLAILRRMTPAEKWNEFCKMRRLAWDLKAAAMRMAHPDWTDAQVQEKVRLIFLYATT